MMKEAHENAIAKGFAGKNSRNQKEILQLILSELGEAMEAHRSGRYSDTKAFEEAVKPYHGSEETAYMKASFETHIKNTYEDELADTLIRIANYIQEFSIVEEIENRGTKVGITDKIGQVIYSSKILDIDIATYISELRKTEQDEFNTGECLFDISYNITRSVDSSNTIIDTNPGDRIGDAIVDILRLAALENVDLEKHTRYKLDYNRTRPYLHGKEY